jgi:hypothetical protein
VEQKAGEFADASSDENEQNEYTNIAVPREIQPLHNGRD